MEINSLKINQEISDIKEKLNGLLDIFYPIGSYYETSNTNFNPNSSWGGTWVEDSKGLVTVGAYDEGMNRPDNDRVYITLNQITGEAEHKLTVDEMPSHAHNIYYNANSFGVGTYENNSLRGIGDGDVSGQKWSTDVGGSQSHNNTQPSIGVRRWHRTA